MTRYLCINCGSFIGKSIISDPYMCKDCEKILEGAEAEIGITHLSLDKY